jgi:chromosome segregation ATPase
MTTERVAAGPLAGAEYNKANPDESHRYVIEQIAQVAERVTALEVWLHAHANQHESEVSVTHRELSELADRLDAIDKDHRERRHEMMIVINRRLKALEERAQGPQDNRHLAAMKRESERSRKTLSELADEKVNEIAGGAYCQCGSKWVVDKIDAQRANLMSGIEKNNDLRTENARLRKTIAGLRRQRMRVVEQRDAAKRELDEYISFGRKWRERCNIASP